MSNVTRDRPTCCALFQTKVRGPNETCQYRGIICTQNVQDLSGKDRILEYLINPIVELMISEEITLYCIQETWLKGNSEGWSLLLIR